MSRSFYYAIAFKTTLAFFILTSVITAEAQERQVSDDDMNPELRRRALVLDINAKVDNEPLAQSYQRIAIPGSPVNIKMVGSNVVVSVQFTPFIRRSGNVLVAHGQIWINDTEKGMSYYTSIQTIPMEINEPISFFPLGQSPELGSSIEIIITVKRYEENAISNNER